MRAHLAVLALLSITACKGDPVDTGERIDADQDGAFANQDCDDNNAAVFPGADELCDELDNDCNGVIDDAPIDPVTWYADADGDGYGGSADTYKACTAPKSFVANSGDCADGNPQIHPDAQERCSGLDDDCDGLVDDSDESVDLGSGLDWWVDADADGYGSGTSAWACEVPTNGADNDLDCDDSNPASYPGAPELCDEQDNNCQGTVDEETLGRDPECAARTCLALSKAGETVTGNYWIDPSIGDPFLAHCDLVSDGGGWTLITWTADSAVELTTNVYQGEPYPGLDVCADLDCPNGSAASKERLEALIQLSGEFGTGMSQATLSTFQPLADYGYASSFDYGDLSGVTLSIGVYDTCEKDNIIKGRNHVISGPTDYDLRDVWTDPELRFANYSYTERTHYIWSYGLSSPCSMNTTMPAVLTGTWFSHPSGPYLAGRTGSRSSWVR